MRCDAASGGASPQSCCPLPCNNSLHHGAPPLCHPTPALPPCQVRERDWCNVLTAHEGDAAAYVWRLQHFSLGEHILKPPAKELVRGGQWREGASVTVE